MLKQFALNSNADQLKLSAYCWKPDTEILKGLVVIAHGMGEHAKRYDEFANALTDEGFVVYSLDHRGHGASPGPNGLGDFGEGGWDALVNDIAQLTEYAKSEYPNLPTILFAHSMGSFAAQQFILTHAILLDALILSGSAAIDQLFVALAAAQAAVEKGEAISALNVGFDQRTGFEWLSRDEAQVDKYVADPLCGFDLSPESLGGMINSAGLLADPEKLAAIPGDLPVLLLAGDRDPVTGNLDHLQVLQQRYIDAGIKQLDTKFYKDGRHEMLNEINREEVIGDVIEWVKKVVG